MKEEIANRLVKIFAWVFWLAVFALVIILLHLMGGCAVSRPATLPWPRPSEKAQEAARSTLGYVDATLEAVENEGAPPRDPMVESAHRGTKTLQAFMGAPAEPFTAPSTPKEKAATIRRGESEISNLKSHITKYRQTMASYEQQVTVQGAGPVKRASLLGRLWGWLWKVVGPVGVIVVLAYTGLLGPVILFLIRAVLRAGRQIREIVEGVQKAKPDLTPESEQALKASLTDTTSADTKKRIALEKEKVKERFREEA
jgi:hypothetical protein